MGRFILCIFGFMLLIFFIYQIIYDLYIIGKREKTWAKEEIKNNRSHIEDDLNKLFNEV